MHNNYLCIFKYDEEEEEEEEDEDEGDVSKVNKICLSNFLIVL